MRQLKSPRVLARVGMLLAMQIALGFVASIQVGELIRISFGFLALAVTGALYGPVPAVLNGALADVIGHFLKPTGPYFPGFTLCGALSGLVYGLLLYRRSGVWWRIALAELIVTVVCNLLLNTLWLQILYGRAFWVILPGRALKNAAQCPVNILLLWPVLRAARSIPGADG